MKSKAGWMIALAVMVGACWNGAVNSIAASNEEEAAEATVMMSSYEAQQKAAAEARAKDPAWKPKSAELAVIQVGDTKQPGALKNFCLNAAGDILACYAPAAKPGADDAKVQPGIRVYSPQGNLMMTLPLDIKPAAICTAKDGTIYVAGDGKVYLLSETGETIVLRAGRGAEIIARNDIGQRTLASMAIADGRIFIRADDTLVCVGPR